MKLDKYAKAITSALAAGAMALTAALSDGALSAEELGLVATAVIGGATAVWAFPNAMIRVAKALTAAAVAGYGTWLVIYADNEVTSQDWVQVAVAAALGFATVYSVPNAGSAARSSSPG